MQRQFRQLYFHTRLPRLRMVFDAVAVIIWLWTIHKAEIVSRWMGSLLQKEWKVRIQEFKNQKKYLSHNCYSKSTIETTPSITRKRSSCSSKRCLSRNPIGGCLHSRLDNFCWHPYQTSSLESLIVHEDVNCKIVKVEYRTTSPAHADSIWFNGAKCAGSGLFCFMESYTAKKIAAGMRIIKFP